MRYTDKEKRQLVQRYQNGETVEHICAETGIARSTFYSWVKPYQTTLTEAGTLVTPQEFVLLKQRVEKLESIIQVLKTVNCTVSSPLKEKLTAMEALYGQFSVHALCDALEVPRGTFYNHILRNKRSKAWYAKRRAELCQKVSDVYEDNNQIFGADKIRAILVVQVETVSKKYVSELMHEMGLSSMSPSAKKEYKYLNEPSAKKNRLNRNFTAERPNQIWVSDITCFKLKGKYYYIWIIMDLYSRRIIAYRTSTHNSTKLISTAFRQMYAGRAPQEGLVFHSDQGAQYTSTAFRNLLLSCDVKQSFSNTGEPHDNAVAESFFSCMKREKLYRWNYSSVAAFKKSVDTYISFYNTKRPHSTLNFKSPNQMEEAYAAKAVSE